MNTIYRPMLGDIKIEDKELDGRGNLFVRDDFDLEKLLKMGFTKGHDYYNFGFGPELSVDIHSRIVKVHAPKSFYGDRITITPILWDLIASGVVIRENRG